MAGIKTKDIASQNGFSLREFELFIGSFGYKMNSGFTGNTVSEEDAPKIIEAFKKYRASIEEKERKDKEIPMQQLQEKTQQAEAKEAKPTDDLIVIPGVVFDGYRITKYGEFLSAECSQEVDRGIGNLNSTARNNALNTRKRIEEAINSIRAEAFDTLKRKVAEQGYNAIIGISYNYVTVEPVTASMGPEPYYLPYVLTCTANGTAVCIEKTQNE